MKLIKPTAEQAPYGLRALKMVAEATGGIHPSAAKLIMAAQENLAGTVVPLEGLAPITPQELAAQITDPALRLQLIQGMVAVSLVSDFPPPKQVEMIHAFARGFGVKSELLDTVQKAVDGHMLAFRMCYLRRTHFPDFAKTQLKYTGAIGVANALATFTGLTENKALSAKYAALASWRPARWGASCTSITSATDSAGPGRSTGFRRRGCRTMFRTSSGGMTRRRRGRRWCRVLWRIPAGSERIFVALFGLIIFSTGYQLPPGKQAVRGDTIGQAGVAARLFRAIERGSQMNKDISVDFMLWPYAERTLEDLRREWNVEAE